MKSRHLSQSGNILLYVLIAIILFAALSFAMMRGGGDSGAAGSLSGDQAAIKASDIIDYATSARATVEQMRTMANVQPTEFSFAKPGDAGYTTGSNAPKVYHPAGGGLSQFVDTPELYANGSGRGWVAQQGTNVQWTPSTASDILFSFVDVSQKICAAINKKLYNDSSIPDLSMTSSAAFVNGGGDDADLTAAACPSCNGRISACVKDSAGVYAFYTIILGR